MADNQAQQIMQSDAYRPQGYGGEWLATQLPTVPVTSELGTIADEGDEQHSVTGGMLWAFVAGASAIGALVGAAVTFVMLQVVRP